MTQLESYLQTPVEFKDDFLAVYDQTERLTIFDIGACEAEDSIRYARLFPRATVWAFEPLPDNFKTAYFNLIRYSAGNVRIFQEALSDRKERSTLYVSSGRPQGIDDQDVSWDYGNKSNSLLSPTEELKAHYRWLAFEKTIEIQTNTLRNFCDTHAIQKIDIAHIDVQGAELRVLQGAGRFLQDIGVIKLEVERVGLYRDQPLKQDIESFMRQQGFIKLRDTVGDVSGDQLYLNKRSYLHHKTASALKFAKKKLNRTNGAPKQGKLKSDEEGGTAQYRKESFSQTGEDLIVDFIFRVRGVNAPTYIDIGAFHPWDMNNTALFYNRGSRGINVEPNPLLFEEISKERPRDVNLNVGIADRKGELDFYLLSLPTLSTFSRAEAEGHVSAQVCELQDVLKIEVDTFDRVVFKYFFNICPDFVSLDTEGLEMAILKSIDFNRRKPKIICVETMSFSTTGRGQKDREVIEFLQAKDYLVYADTYLNTIFVLRDFWLI